MKRSGGWARRKPLAPGAARLRRGALVRQSAMTRTAAARKPPPEIKLPKPTRRPMFPPGLREAVYERAGHCCDMCGQILSVKSWECHHRRLRSQGGRDEPENLLALHHSCHRDAHSHRDWARDCGYIVHSGDDPATQPVLRHGWRWQIPTPDGWVRVAELIRSTGTEIRRPGRPSKRRSA